jgi:hypothetical protein
MNRVIINKNAMFMKGRQATRKVSVHNLPITIPATAPAERPESSVND